VHLSMHRALHKPRLDSCSIVRRPAMPAG
jgi:hypothetical protein